ncbi:MAG: pyruvate formate lyase family protein [Kiritimatiellae bacterium]|nr:pyruvate formate lyase family protein [Kiritimatiellia bacterium]MDD5522438.1 pyruvate formate lyase family protein [Kiritimatiellia bacterium]
MITAIAENKLSYTDRLMALCAAKSAQTREKQRVRGSMDSDDHGIILPPEELRRTVQSVNSSGVPFTDVVLDSFKPRPNHPNGNFYGPRACGENFRALLDVHPVYIDPMSSLAGAYMTNFLSYRTVHWKPEFDRSELLVQHEKYHIIGATGAVQHMCQDMAIGLKLGWGGLLDKIHHYCEANIEAKEFYDGLEQMVLGIQDWIHRHAETARRMAADHPDMSENLMEIAEMNEYLVSNPPRTFREACQWILWNLLVTRMYNGSGSLGRLDLFLEPYYEADIRAERLTDEEAVFHIACMLLRDTPYLQLGGPDATGKDIISRVSFLVLEAAHKLRTPVNVGICVGKEVDPQLLRRGVEILLEDRCGVPKFLGVDNTIAGFTRSGFPVELARERAYSGCQWSAIPGREYAIQDIIKINFVKVFDVALREMIPDSAVRPCTAELWDRFVKHLRQAVAITAAGIDFQYRHMHEVFPELAMDLLSHGPIEKGLDASHGGVEYYTFGVDGAGLATVADSFAAIEERVEKQRRLSWKQLLACLDSNWAGNDGERARLMMKNVPRYGAGGTSADAWAKRIASTYTDLIKEKRTPDGHMMIPGLFSWALSISMGKKLSATPDGRRAGEPISHGANPNPGFRKDGAPTALAVAVASVQPGYGNTAPLQMDLDPCASGSTRDIENIESLIRGHFELGGTQINANILDRNRIIEANKNPTGFPELIVRVTGFSAYFASLSPELRQVVVDRVIQEKGAAV